MSGDADWLTPYVARTALAWQGPPGHEVREGTLVSADISGFTALAERLAVLGREGSEELTAVLNARFAEMIVEVHRRGGDVLKFGGDALLCWFEGRDHAARAVHASGAMRKVVRRRVSSAFAGNLKLSISIGLHPGAHDLVLVDVGPLVDFWPIGPGAAGALAAESAAGRNEILAPATSVDSLPPDVVVERRDQFVVVRPAGADLACPRPEGGADPTRHVPESQREWLAVKSRTLGEHRRGCVTFIEVAGVGELLETSGGEMAATVLQRILAQVGEACGDHHTFLLGTDVHADGIKLILGAGIPTTTGDDAPAAVASAHAVIQRVTHLPVRAGVSSGAVFLGNLGADDRRAYTVMGDTVNVAARLMGAARAGEVLVTDEVAQDAAPFLFDGLEPLKVKGKREPLRAHRVVGIDLSGGHVVESEEAAELVGRETEVEELRRRVADRAAGRGGLVVIQGEPGIGKTHLIFHVCRELDVPLLVAHGSIVHQRVPYGVLRQLVRPLLGVAVDAPSELVERRLRQVYETELAEDLPFLPLVGLAFGLELPSTPESRRVLPEFATSRMLQLLGDLLDLLAPRGFVGVVEDLDVVDAATVEALGLLRRRLADRPWLFLATLRGAEVQDVGVEPIQLGPLSTESIVAIIEREEGHHLAPSRVSELALRSGGNPMFALELARSAGDGVVPDGIESAVAMRLDRLPPEPREMVMELAVLGTAADLAGIGQAIGLTSAAAQWREVREVVEVDGTRAVFKQRLLQEAAYRALPFRRRRALHERVATWLEAHDPENVDDLSLHWSQTANRERAWEYGVQAAERATSRYSLRDAARLYERALRAGRQIEGLAPSALAQVAESLADAAEGIGEMETARQSYQLARKWFDDRLPARARLMGKIGLLEERSANYTGALRWFGRALTAIDREAGHAAPALAKDIQVHYAGVRYRQGRYVEAMQWARRAEENARLCDDVRTLAHSYRIIDNCMTYRGEQGRYGERARALYQRVGDLKNEAMTLNNLGVAAYLGGDWARAVELYTDFTERSEAMGHVAYVAQGHVNLGEVHSDLGNLDEADSHLSQASRGFVASGFELGRLMCQSNIGRLRHRQGAFDEARELLLDAREHLHAAGAGYYVRATDVRLAELALDEGCLDEARDHLERAEGIEASDPTLDASLARAKAIISLAAGEPEAPGALDDAWHQATEADARFETAMTMLVVSRSRGEPDLETQARQLLTALGGRTLVLPPGLGLVPTPQGAPRGSGPA